MKSSNEVTLQLVTTQVVGEFSPNRIDDQDRQLITPTLDLVTGICLPDGEIVINDVHSSRMDLVTPTGKEGVDAITLSSPKARRLINRFGKLAPDHPYECHDVVGAVERWDRGAGMDNYHYLLDDTDPIQSGKPYEVFAYAGRDMPKGEWTRTHSALGTDSERLLGLVGQGLMLVITDKQTTLDMYNGGHQSTLAENIHQSVARRVVRSLVQAR